MKPGDVVYLRVPLAPPMVVDAITDNGKYAVCMWFTDDKHILDHHFEISLLTLNPPGPIGAEIA